MGKSATRSGFASASDGQSSEAFLVTNSYHLNYFQLPLLVKIKAVKKLNFYAGPSVGYILSRKVDRSVTSINASNGFETKQNVDFKKEEVKRSINDLDISGHVGVGFGIKKFELFTSYERSFISAFKDPEKQFSNLPMFNTIKFGVSYRF
ncbi:MAG: hypothetical protein JWQ25_1750 [Daejeonella sp.]|nr:hypothetical protein [Daejeonella sp.]